MEMHVQGVQRNEVLVGLGHLETSGTHGNPIHGAMDKGMTKDSWNGSQGTLGFGT